MIYGIRPAVPCAAGKSMRLGSKITYPSDVTHSQSSIVSTRTRMCESSACPQQSFDKCLESNVPSFAHQPSTLNMPIVFIRSIRSSAYPFPTTHHHSNNHMPIPLLPRMWSPDPFHRSKDSSFPITKKGDVNPYTNYYTDSHDYFPKHRRRRDPFHQSPFYVEGSDFSDVEFDDTYSLDTDTTLDNRLQSAYLPRRHTTSPLAINFKRVQIRMLKRVAEHVHEDEVLILSPDLTRLRIQVRSAHSSESMRAAVAGDMRLRDVVKQVLSNAHGGEVLVQVKVRGEWVDISGSHMISEIVEHGRGVLNSRQEVEVRVSVGTGREKKPRTDVRGWEHEIGRMERMRVY
ncbi:hypothetical protein BKA63DRAFT_319519 [Paraphoma chrysanthemicola]|nr:hypothetical protein BKA63DRAFT_319519 [Paraphoma chrysanthemicola]